MKIFGEYGPQWEPEYVDIEGNPVERDRWNYPYSYDPYVLYKHGYRHDTDGADYSDRLYEWDPVLFGRCCRETWGNERQRFDDREPEEIEKFLTKYFGKKTVLTGLEQGCNVSSGYPYWIFYYHFDET